MIFCRIVVSAPKLTVPNSAVSATGAVYTCEVNPVTEGQCEGLMGNGMGVDRRLYDIDGEYRALPLNKQDNIYIAIVLVLNIALNNNPPDEWSFPKETSGHLPQKETNKIRINSVEFQYFISVFPRH